MVSKDKNLIFIGSFNLEAKALLESRDLTYIINFIGGRQVHSSDVNQTS